MKLNWKTARPAPSPFDKGGPVYRVRSAEFLKTANVTGIVLTKLDGTAKGGIAVAIAKELDLPIRYVGIGEQVNDLMVFDAESYVNGLFS